MASVDPFSAGFGSALIGPDGTADPVVKARPAQVFADPTAAPRADGGHSVTVDPHLFDSFDLPPLPVGLDEAAVAALVAQAAPALLPVTPPPVTGRRVPPGTPPPRVAAPPPPVTRYPPPAHTSQVAAPPTGQSIWNSLPRSVTSHLPAQTAAAIQAWMPPQTPPAPAVAPHQVPPVTPPRPAPQQAANSKKGGSFSCLIVLVVLAVVLFNSGALDDLWHMIQDLLDR